MRSWARLSGQRGSIAPQENGDKEGQSVSARALSGPHSETGASDMSTKETIAMVLFALGVGVVLFAFVTL